MLDSGEEGEAFSPNRKWGVLIVLRNEFRKVLHTRALYFAVAVGLLCSLCGLYSYANTAYYANAAGHGQKLSAYNAWLDCLSVGSSLYRVVAPLLIVPCLDGYFLERRSGYRNLVLARSTRGRYYVCKWFAGVLSAAGIVLVVLSVTFLVCWIFYPLNQPLSEMTHLHKNFGLEFFLDRPMVAIGLMILGNMFFAAVYFTVGFSLSGFLSNRYLLLLTPFALYLIQLLLWQTFHLPWLSPLIFVAYYEVLGLTPAMMGMVGLAYVLISALALLCGFRRDGAIV